MPSPVGRSYGRPECRRVSKNHALAPASTRACRKTHRRLPSNKGVSFRPAAHPVVMAAVEKIYRCRRELHILGIVEAAEIHRVVLPTNLRNVPVPEGVHAAGPAEHVVALPRPELVVRQLVFARQQPKRCGFTTTPHLRIFVQIEQLHLPVPARRSMSASNCTLPQWQLPLYVLTLIWSFSRPAHPRVYSLSSIEDSSCPRSALDLHAMLQTSARLLRLLSLLQQRRQWSGRDLSERLEMDGRTVRRDVERLRELGYPVQASSARRGLPARRGLLRATGAAER